MTAAPIHLAGERLQLDPAGALHWPAQRLLVVADLHFEKGTAAAAKGQLVPPWDTGETLSRLTALLRKYGPRTLIALGDSFHDAKGAARLQPHDHAQLHSIARETHIIWVLGNHDPTAPEGLPGDAVPEHRQGPLTFRHQATPGRVMGELSGHFHPKASIPVRGTTITRPCFVTDGYRILLPAIGAYTGGLDTRDPAIATLFPRGGRLFLTGRERLHSFPFPPSRRGPTPP